MKKGTRINQGRIGGGRLRRTHRHGVLEGCKMNQIRTRIKQDYGTWKEVFGWYCKIGARHFIIPPTARNHYDENASYLDHEIYGVEAIDPSHTAVATGKMAKGLDGKEVMVYGSMEVDGMLFADGDSVCSWVKCGNYYPAEWSKDQLTWMAGRDRLCDVNVVILPRKEV